MKSLLRCAPLALVLIGFLFSSCDLVTVPSPPPDNRPANHVVINEVFTLPESMANAYSWIEFYNPTTERVVGLHRWSFTYTYHWVSQGMDTLLRLTQRLGDYSFFSAIPDTLEPGQFLVLFGDSISFYNHTNLGPGKGTVTIFPIVLREQDELVLQDTSGTPVDVVRYGSYVPPSPDPFPGNSSAGPIPAWQSLSRYAGAYFTGNTANDFYMESRPIPMWYSELNHP